MRSLLDTFIAASKFGTEALGFSNYLARRNKLSFQVDIKWTRPKKVPVYHPVNSGDLELMPKLEGNKLYGHFKKSKEIENADAKVKDIFSLKFQMPKHRLIYYKTELIEKVRNHAYDYNSLDVKIASLTGTVRNLAKLIDEAKNRRIRLKRIKKYFYFLSIRQKKLELLRKQDYKKFEWILEQLNIAYKPIISAEEQEVSRKKSVAKLVQLKQEKIKEKNLAKLKESLDKQKIPFLEEKIQKLRWIKDLEEKNNFPKTVTEADIDACMKRLEEVKIEVARNMEIGYERRIHPYTFEPYFDKLLKTREKAGELIREPEIANEPAEAK